jgi:hypothetical protein
MSSVNNKPDGLCEKFTKDFAKVADFLKEGVSDINWENRKRVYYFDSGEYKYPSKIGEFRYCWELDFYFVNAFGFVKKLSLENMRYVKYVQYNDLVANKKTLKLIIN